MDNLRYQTNGGMFDHGKVKPVHKKVDKNQKKNDKTQAKDLNSFEIN